MGRYIVATIKTWNIENFRKLRDSYTSMDFLLVDNKEDLSIELVDSFKPDYIFFPHWSWIIPKELFQKYNCVVFHMTDLPFGRGGSPLQNLLVRGIYETKISAIKVCEELDAGPIYLKESLNIGHGSANEVFEKISDIIFKKMIPRFIDSDIMVPNEQNGEVVVFKRRTPAQSEIPDGLTQRQLYDYIRMLDGEGYPTAFRKYGNGRIYYTDADYNNGIVTAKASFVEYE